MPSKGTIASIATETASKFVPQSSASVVARVEDVRIRNYDPKPHRLSLMVADETGTALHESYELPPEAAVSLIDKLDEGRYEVSAVLDGARLATAQCEVAPDPAGTIFVEMGNGIISVSNGR